MNTGPIPPHERTWRHPSEVAAAQRAELHAAPPGREAQRLALGAGACVVALVIVALFATFSTKTSIPQAEVQASIPAVVAQISVPSVRSLPGEPVSISHSGAALRPDGGANSCLATPVGSGQFALVTTPCVRDVARDRDTPSTGSDERTQFVVILPDRSLQLASLVDVDTADALSGLAMVSLTTPVDPISVASSGLSAADSLALIGSRYIDYSLSELIEMPLPDGTPILNQDGELVAISSHEPGGVSVLISVDGGSVADILNQALSGPPNSGTPPLTVPSSAPLAGDLSTGD